MSAKKDNNPTSPKLRGARKKIGIDDLARMMQVGFSGLETRIGGLETRMSGLEKKIGGLENRIGNLEVQGEGLLSQLKELNGRVTDLERNSFSEEEKDEILAMVRHYDKRLESEALGKEFVVLRSCK
jgi:uncharacterized coiled-coil protein SlyX